VPALTTGTQERKNGQALMTRDGSPKSSSHEPASGPVSVRLPRSTPPPLPRSATRIPAARLAADDAFAESMLERLAAGDYEGARLAAHALLEYRPRDQDALDCAQIAESELRRLYATRLGSLTGVPYVAMGPDAILALPALDSRAGFLLSRVDGVTSVHDLVDAAFVPALEALRILSELFLRRVIAFRP
jgi:hypothetical protein